MAPTRRGAKICAVTSLVGGISAGKKEGNEGHTLSCLESKDYMLTVLTRTDHCFGRSMVMKKKKGGNMISPKRNGAG